MFCKKIVRQGFIAVIGVEVLMLSSYWLYWVLDLTVILNRYVRIFVYIWKEQNDADFCYVARCRFSN